MMLLCFGHRKHASCSAVATALTLRKMAQPFFLAIKNPFFFSIAVAKDAFNVGMLNVCSYETRDSGIVSRLLCDDCVGICPAG